MENITASECSSDKVSFELKDNWKFRDTSTETWHPATVPGVNHLDLLNNKLIPDPYYRDGENLVAWVEDKDWEYQTEFTLPVELRGKRQLRFIFHGLDTHAYVTLNGKFLHESHSQFNRYYVPVPRDADLDSPMSLDVLFKSAPKHDRAKNEKLNLPGDNCHMWSRKAGYHYGWDWGPRICVSGIWKPVEIQGFDSAVIEHAYTYLKRYENECMMLGMELEFTAETAGAYSFQADIKGSISSSSTSLVVEKPGTYTIEHEMRFQEGNLWWPNGHGPQQLYEIEFTLSKGTKLVVDNKTITTGFRTVELVQDKDEKGRTFYFKVNGKKIFMKGANYIPPDNLMHRMTEEKYRSIVEIARESNFNMLRVWGGGQYEDEALYRALDENGILIWHDFMFAGGMYPADEEYSAMMEVEFEQQVKALRGHPSMTIYCGNNEISEGWNHWGWKKGVQEDLLWSWYKQIFEKLIPAAVSKYDKSQLPYWPTSPLHGWGLSKSMQEGDSHNWAIWHGKQDLEIMNEKVPRFMVEYGMQGMPNIESIKKFTTKGDRCISSEVMKIHQKHHSGWQLIQSYLDRYYREAKCFESYIYTTQLLQAMAFQITIEAERRSKPYCMGTLYWQLNDCWPVTSWATVDYDLVWKAAQYRIKKYYEPVIVSIYENLEQSLEVYIISDDSEQRLGSLEIILMDVEGHEHWSKRVDVKLDGAQSSLVFSEKTAAIIKKVLPREAYFLRTTLHHRKAQDLEGIHTVFEHFYYFSKPKDLKLREPSVTIEADGASKQLIIRTKNLVKDLYIYIEGDVLELEQNYFDISPGTKYIGVKANSWKKIEPSCSNIKYVSLWNTYNGKAGLPYK